VTGYPDAVSVAVSSFFKEIDMQNAKTKQLQPQPFYIDLFLGAWLRLHGYKTATPNITLQPT
jgi:hypothetical protein